MGCNLSLICYSLRWFLANILIVDDDIAVQAVIRLLLERDGHDVQVASDGLKGLKTFETGDFDLLIVDIFMPGMDGLETMRLVHQQRPDIPIIVISGRPIPQNSSAGPDFLAIAIKLGAINTLQKPFKAPVLRAMVTKCLEAAKSFKGIARRQELRGEVQGIKVIDDFGHHPTAIASTLQALRHRFRGKRLWAVFEPRSNTTRRAVFQQQLPEALKIADGVFISQVARLAQIPEDQRLNPERVVAAIAKAGRPAFYEQNADAIVDRIVPMLRPKDVVAVFSNGGFDNIHEKLLTRLRE